MLNFSRSFKVSSRAVAKTIKRYDETGSKERKTQNYFCSQGISSLELTALQIAAQIVSSQSSNNRHISTSTVQERLRESGLHGQIASKKPLLKDNNNNKRLAWAKKHKQWTLDWWKSVLWSDESKFEIFVFNCRVFVGCRVGELIIFACVVSTVKHGGGGVMVLCW